MTSGLAHPRDERGPMRVQSRSISVLALLTAPPGCAVEVPGPIAPHEVCELGMSRGEPLDIAVLDLDPLTPELRTAAPALEAVPRYDAHFVVRGASEGASIELFDPVGRRIPGGHFRTRVGVTLDPSPEVTTQVARVEVIPPSVARTLTDAFIDTLEGDGRITAQVQLDGASSTQVVPIDLCYGCLYEDAAAVGDGPACLPGQDATFGLPGFVRTAACVDSGECRSGLCVLGHCARDDF